jgi:FeS assembly SUF system regulator
MFKLSKLTDYGTVVLAHLARRPEQRLSATDVAEATRLGAPTVSKLMKMLSKGGLVTATRGATGGYALARPPAEINAAEIINALEGPLAVTECSDEDGHCNIEHICGVGQSWQRINEAIRETLEGISLAELARAEFPLRWYPAPPAGTKAGQPGV